MCMCTEFVIQVLKQKNAHVSNPVGMISDHFHADFRKESPSRTFWRGSSPNCRSPSSVLCVSLCRTEHFSRGREGRQRRRLSGPVWDAPPISRKTFSRWYRRVGYRTHFPCFHVVSRKYRWDTPFVGGGGIAPPLRMLSEWETLRKGEGVSRPIGHVKPHSAQ